VIIVALGSDGLFENVPTLSPSAGFATGPFAKVNRETTIHHSLRKLLATASALANLCY
jgi:hypothetical protein